MDQIPVATWIKGSDGRVQFANRNFGSLVGLAADQLIGKTTYEIFPQDVADEQAAGDRLALNSPGPIELNEQLVLADGSVADLFVLKFPIPGSGGKPQIGGAAFDVTKLRETERSLHESEERFHSFMDNSPALAWMKDEVGRYVYVNRAFRELFWWRDDQVHGKTDHELFPDFAEEYRRNDLAILESKLPAQVTEHVLLENGDRRGMLNVKFRFDYRRDRAFIGGIGLDVTDRLRAESSLAESEARFRSVFEQSPSGMMIADQDGRLLRVNSAFRAMLGRSEEELRSATLPELTHPDDLEPTVENAHKLLAGELLYYIMGKRYLRPDGRIVWASVSTGLVRDEDGKPLCFVGQIQDITRQRHDQELIRSSLAEKELLLSEIHHRVKNNLQIIASLLYLQSQYPMEPASAGLFLESRERVIAMALVHERIYRSDNLAAVDFAEYVRELAALLLESYRVTGPSVKVELDLEPMNLPVDDAVRCGLIVNELVSNALKHAFPTGTSGTLGLRASSSGGRIGLEVVDDGVGISPDLTPEQTKTFGLRMVASMVSHLGGTFEIDRSRGTTFRVTIPLTKRSSTGGRL